ncbi:MAG: YheT family hydrolase [Myxococcota bacterium]
MSRGPRFPAFAARAPWWGPDLQTVRNVLRPPAPPGVAAERRTLPLSDGSGDALIARLQPPPEERGRALAVLIHGLSGSADSAYMHASASALLHRGHPVLRLDLRGAGESRALCRLQYHAGRTADLRDALLALPEARSSAGLVLMGFSLGANLLLKFLAEYGDDFPIVAAASVSAPLDLSAASRRFMARRNRFYQRHMLAAMKTEATLAGAELSEDERRAIASARTVWEFDERFVAPRNGWAGAEDYYAANAALRFLPEIRVPTLVIHALDDPWIPGETHRALDWTRSPGLIPLLPAAGGHVGFHGRDDRQPWHDRCLAAFLDALGA